MACATHRTGSIGGDYIRYPSSPYRSTPRSLRHGQRWPGAPPVRKCPPDLQGMFQSRTSIQAVCETLMLSTFQRLMSPDPFCFSRIDPINQHLDLWYYLCLLWRASADPSSQRNFFRWNHLCLLCRQHRCHHSKIHAQNSTKEV